MGLPHTSRGTPSLTHESSSSDAALSPAYALANFDDPLESGSWRGIADRESNLARSQEALREVRFARRDRTHAEDRGVRVSQAEGMGLTLASLRRAVLGVVATSAWEAPEELVRAPACFLVLCLRVDAT